MQRARARSALFRLRPTPPEEPDRTGDATGYACATHGNFKVANTVPAEAKAEHYTREQWEAALHKATQRMKSGEWPVIDSYDF
jgi:hypothetical protein